MVAGICEIKYVKREDVDVFPFVDELPPLGISTADIVLKNGKAWQSWSIDPGTAEFKQEQVERNGNKYFRQRITWRSSGVALEAQRYGNCNCMHIVKITDTNGVVHLVGSLNNPAQINYSSNIEKKRTGENAYNFQYFCDSMWHTVTVSN